MKTKVVFFDRNRTYHPVLCNADSAEEALTRAKFVCLWGSIRARPRGLARRTFIETVARNHAVDPVWFRRMACYELRRMRRHHYGNLDETDIAA